MLDSTYRPDERAGGGGEGQGDKALGPEGNKGNTMGIYDKQ